VSLATAAEAAILAHARRLAPEECCGLLLGKDADVLEAVAVANVAEDRRRRYRIDPPDHFRIMHEARRRALTVIGAYHSHPRSAAVPSETDRAEAFSEFLFLIAGLGIDPPELRAWIYTDGNFVPVPLVRHL
jgi:proteasome lid subunit RPN8/RPN11